MGTSVYDLLSSSEDTNARPAGWCGGDAPAIPRDAWPRSPMTGFPMIHVLTLELPSEYRRKGKDLVGISIFQADDHAARAVPGAREIAAGAAPTKEQATQSFYQDLVRARECVHPRATPLEDIIGGHFMLIWLTAEELGGPRLSAPVDHRKGVVTAEVGQNLNPWDNPLPLTPIFLVERPFDPNAGKAPTESTDTGYVDVILAEDPELKAFYEQVHGRSHLGGTCLPVQAMPEGLTPFFLELEDGMGGANFGGGNMQLDLESGVFDWAC